MAALPARWLHVRRPDIHLDLIQKEVLFKILSPETEVKVCSCDLRQSGNCETHRRQSAASGLQFIEQLGINHQINASKSAVNPSFFFLRASVHPGTINDHDDSSVQTHSRS